MAKYDPKELGATLKELRGQNDLSQRDVAVKLGISQGTYFRIEAGQAVEDDMLFKLGKVFKMPMRALLSYMEDKKKMSLAHLKGNAAEFVLDPRNANYIQEAIINKQIADLVKQKEELHKKEEEPKVEEVNYGTILRPITRLFDDEVGGTDLETIQFAIGKLRELHETCSEYEETLDAAICDLESLLSAKISQEGEIDPEELLSEADCCIEGLRGF